MMPAFGDADVVVLGAGMAGMCAAARAAEAGARVVVLERAPTIGGSAALSHGNVWTVADAELLDREDPGPYRVHARRVVEDFAPVTDWLSCFGGATEPRRVFPRQQVQRFNVPLTFLRMAQRVEASGGHIVTSAQVTDVSGRDGTFRLRVDGQDSSWTLLTRSLVVATGGRQADPAVRTELSAGTPAALRGNQYSDGQGIALAVSLGAGVNFANRGFYGHLLPTGVEPLSGLDYLALTLYHSTHGILLDRTGARFTDESAGDARNATALAARGGPGILLWSEKVQRAAAVNPAPVDLAIDRWHYARDRGARVARADSLSAVEACVQAWGFPHLPSIGTNPLRTLLGGGPVYLAEVRPGMTFTYGGLRADDQGQVLDPDGHPVPHLFTAGADMSDIYHLGYCGGLSAAAVTGVRAGDASAAVATRRDL
jgi:tricarballylate dehydrogenase